MEGIADGAAVDSVVYQFFATRNPGAVKTRVVWQSEEFAMPPVVVPKGIDLRQKEELRALFLGIGQDPEGQRVLAQMGIDRFVAPNSALPGNANQPPSK